MTSTIIGKFSSFMMSPIVKTYAPQFVRQRLLHVSAVDLRARKGTREKALKKKVKVEVKKVGFISHNLRGKDKQKLLQANKHKTDDLKKVSPDDVWPIRFYRQPTYSLEDAIAAHQETHHPTMYNDPDALINVQIELNMIGEKITRFMENFNRIALIPHGFPREEDRTILVFCKGQELLDQARDAGATLAGSVELIKKIQSGDIVLQNFNHIVAHPNILTDLVPLRGLMKRRFPNPRAGTVDMDLPALIKKFTNGIAYKCDKDEYQKSFGLIETSIGRCNMPTKNIAENFIALIKDVNTRRPKRDGYFVTRCFLVSPPTTEKLRIDPFVFIEGDKKSKGSAPAATSEDAGSDAESDSDGEEKSKAAKQAA